ncbi:MAG: hypothetical protein VR65_03340 [Desulfobulbaceae bacterium BRH_c16a]|nr:MAG: hypothetical protein VR65_03340 [Desulfobulbaceae bacterium BRH_c16a]
MKLNDWNMTLAKQFRLGLGIILLVVLVLGGVAWRQADLLWRQTETMYNHPLQVRRAADEMEVVFMGIHGALKDMMLAGSNQEIAAALQEIEILKARAFRQIEVMYDRYLGPRSDIVALEKELVAWNAIHEETVRLVREGRIAEAKSRSHPGGVGGNQAGVLLGQVNMVGEFAKNKGNALFLSATAEKNTLKYRLTIIIGVILLLTLYVSYILQRSIRKPLGRLTAAAERFRAGAFDTRSTYTAANEFGVLSAAFNAMAEAVEKQMHIDLRAARLAEVMLRETEVDGFCRELIKELLQQSGSQSGAIYFLNTANNMFEQFAAIGLAGGSQVSFSAATREGEFGAALATGRMQRISEIPEDTRFALSTVSGLFIPREIITLPLLAGQEVVAMISLASIRSYEETTPLLLEKVLGTLTARINGVLAFRQVQELAERLDHQNRELNVQRREMLMQAEELTRQNAELEMQKTQLEAAHRLKTSFLSNMSHELRTPLNSVIALSSVLNRRLAGVIPADEFSYLEVIERNGKNLLMLINDVLDLSRVESGREEMRLTCFAMGALAGEVVEMLAPLAREKGIVLENLVEEDLPVITSDADKVRHILQNLIGNAVKFTDAGSVEISARQVDNRLAVVVRDTGIGIAAAHLPRIFEEFRQADEGTSRRYGGTGLGLAIANRYAALLHGGITVESTPGQGSTFTLWLPLTLDLPGVAVDKSVSTPLKSAVPVPARVVEGRGRCILLIEDSEPAVIQMTDILTGRGYRVAVAQNGREALAQIDSFLPDAVILDLMMPEMDGFEVLRQIRSTERTASLPVLILTAKHVTKEELSFLKGNHVYQLIQKGDVSRTELLTAVAGMIEPLHIPPAAGSRRWI